MTAYNLAPFATKRLAMRPFRTSDVADAHAIFGNAEVMRYSLSGIDLDLAATEARLARYVERTARDGIGLWAVVERASGLVIGSCGLARLNEESPIEIAYRLRRDRWGEGLASEAAGAMLRRGLDALELPRIIAYIEPSNTASLRVVAKIGMRYERDWLYDGKIPVQVFVATRDTE